MLENYLHFFLCVADSSDKFTVIQKSLMVCKLEVIDVEEIDIFSEAVEGILQ